MKKLMSSMLDSERVGFVVAVTVFVCFIVSLATVRADGKEPSSKLIAALSKVESGNNDRAIGDRKRAHKAYGRLQIRQFVCDDLNSHYGTKYRAVDCLDNRALSTEICK